MQKCKMQKLQKTELPEPGQKKKRAESTGYQIEQEKE